MKLVVNHYNIEFQAVIADPAPIPGAKVEHLLYGIPPSEIRQIWTTDIDDLSQLMEIIDRQGVLLNLSRSPYWSGQDLHDPGERLFGISLVDDPNY
jgi:hypothetical protein